MTALVIKMISSAAFSGQSEARVFSFPALHTIRFSLTTEQRFVLARVLLFGILIAVFAYLFFMVSILIQGGRLPERERALRALEEERRVQFALLSAARSPEKVIERATGNMRMITVSEIKYIGTTESVATVSRIGS